MLLTFWMDQTQMKIENRRDFMQQSWRGVTKLLSMSPAAGVDLHADSQYSDQIGIARALGKWYFWVCGNEELIDYLL